MKPNDPPPRRVVDDLREGYNPARSLQEAANHLFRAGDEIEHAVRAMSGLPRGVRPDLEVFADLAEECAGLFSLCEEYAQRARDDAQDTK